MTSARVPRRSWLRPFARQGPTDGPHPDRRVYVVGDVHGCSGLLDELLARIGAYQARYPAPADLVCVGDYVDRGPDSAGVLTRLAAFDPASFHSVTCLRGNHEEMFLDFLSAPTLRNGMLWLSNGGDAAAWSFGVATPEEDSDQAMADFCARLSAAMPDGPRDWLAARPLLWTSGNLVVSHAGLDPALPVAEQSDHALLWSRPRGKRRRDGIWVAHGHTITEPARIEDGRIATDTGAFATGILTAAIIEPEGSVRFLDTGGGPPRDAFAPPARA